MKDPTTEVIKFRDVLSVKYILMIIGGLIFAACVIYLFPSSETRNLVFYLLLLAVIGLMEFYSFSRKVLIRGKSVIISYRPFMTTAHGWNSIDRSRVWGYRYTIRFTMDNVKSVKLLQSSEAKNLSERKFGYLANGKEAVLIEFINSLPVNMMSTIGSSKPVSVIACSVKDTQVLYSSLCEGIK